MGLFDQLTRSWTNLVHILTTPFRRYAEPRPSTAPNDSTEVDGEQPEIEVVASSLEPFDTFVRVLDPSDRWLLPLSFSQGQREENFRGRPDWDISVAMESRCAPPKVLAALHGARKDVVLDRPAYYSFGRSEVEGVGGDFKDTPANPPWPADYDAAHHDIVKAHADVARHMASLYDADPTRVSEEPEDEILLLIAALLGQPGVHKDYKKGATYRFRRMFEDGGAERERWKRVAKEHHFLLEQASVTVELRRTYQDRPVGRQAWTDLMDELGVSDVDRAKFK